MSYRRVAVTLAFVMAAFLSVACGKNEYAARAVNEETDRCAQCNMAVADGPHATQIVLKDGRTLVFDDIGCMYAWMAENGDDEVGQAFVRDYRDLGWIKLEKAYHVYDASFRTPMAYGVLSFASKSDAEAFIAEQGKGVLMTADDLSNHSWERNRDMMEGMEEHGHGADGAMHGEDGAHDGMDAGGHDAVHGGEAVHGQEGGHEGDGAAGAPAGGHEAGAMPEDGAAHGGMAMQEAGQGTGSGDGHGDAAGGEGADVHGGPARGAGPAGEAVAAGDAHA